MTTGPSFHSDEEILRRLHTAMEQAAPGLPGDPAHDAAVHEAHSLVAEVASRIYDDPNKWGIAYIPEEFRDEAAQDAFIDMLARLTEAKERRSASMWFAVAAEERFRGAWGRHEQQEAAPDAGESDGLVNPAQAFDDPAGPWKRFEDAFPRDASALRMRYIEGMSAEQMEIVIDAQNARVVQTRVARARDRFKMFCEQAGYNRLQVAAILQRFGGGEAEV